MKNASQNAGTKPANEKSDFNGEVEIFNAAETELERMREELASEREARLRLAAEYENYRRRTKREMAQAADEGKRALIERLISLADDLDLALANAEKSPDAVADGLRLIHSRFADTLAANGVTAFDSAGKKFDPEWHEAFDVISGSENESDTVQTEIRRGYLWNSKLLRPALVVVAQ